uniref:NADH-ubiquinone oxidoreductase chain 2 n=1 Tax=Metanigrus guttatus TaxID=3038047 RepID=A0AB38XXW7_9HEMI
MKINNQIFLTLIIMFSSNILILTSSNWSFSWMLMEISSISFIPLMSLSKKMSYQMMKFFIIQSIASSLIILMLFMKQMFIKQTPLMIILLSSFMLKTGLFPMHFWMPQIFSFLSFMNCLMISTIQKISPLILISQTMKYEMINISLNMSLIIGSINLMKQNKTKKMLAYISLFSMPWMISSIYMSKYLFFTFMSSYTFINMILIKLLTNMNMKSINHLWAETKLNKINIQSSIISIMGLPPMMGFLPKWLVLQNLTMNNIILALIMILTSAMISLNLFKMSMLNLFLTMPKKKKMNKSLSNYLMMTMMSINFTILPYISMLYKN